MNAKRESPVFPGINEINQLPLTHSETIPEHYRDVMNHVNVMWYTHLFDNGIYELFRQIGLGEEYRAANHSGSFALETHVRHLAEVLIGDTVQVRTRLIARTEKRFQAMNFLTNGDVLSATFEVVGCYIDMRTRRMAAFPLEITDKLDVLLARHQQLAWEAPLCGVMAP